MCLIYRKHDHHERSISSLWTFVLICCSFLLLTACGNTTSPASTTESAPTPVTEGATDTDFPSVTSSDAATVAAPTDDTASVESSAEITTTAELSYNDCPFEPPESASVTCATLIVPEDRSQPDGNRVELAVAIIESFADEPANDPMIYLDGGPGNSALSDLDSWIDYGYADERDVVLFDQRGTGYSLPDLNCPEYDEFDDTIDAMQACHDRLVAEGIDLTQYNSAASAADVNDLIRALGYEEANLFGISYGTRLALTTMRDFPDHIRSVVLDSVYPPDGDSYIDQAHHIDGAFTALFEGCAANEECNEAFPDLEEMFYTLVDELDAETIDIEFINAETDELEEVTVDGQTLIDMVFNTLYDTDTIPILPLVIADTAEGYDDWLIELAESGVAGFGRYQPVDAEPDGDSEGMFYSVECHEEMALSDYDTAIEEASKYPYLEDYLVSSIDEDAAICAIWGAGSADPIESENVESDIPTLILVGSYDPVTPPEWAQLAAEGLTNHQYYEFPGFGHSVSVSHDCPASIALQFLDDPTAEPDAGCLEDLLDGPDFELP
ncbi:MAG: alpha/beta fold hydrolase [Chloroflexaceae bacterium]|nr:alpha/beta fold hydrolase [Chloroflexaceae bacterium]